MSTLRIDFALLVWERFAPGVCSKAITRGGRRLPVVEFSRESAESDWRMKERIGYILEAEFAITFGDGRREVFAAGDGIFIPEGKLEKN
jgi:hypothetical protein